MCCVNYLTILNESKRMAVRTLFRPTREKKKRRDTHPEISSMEDDAIRALIMMPPTAFQLTLFIFCRKILCFYRNITQNCISVNLS